MFERIAADSSLPALAHELFNLHAQEYRDLQMRIAEVEDKLDDWRHENEKVRRLGATNVIRYARLGRGQPSPWLTALVKRKPPMLAAVAWANKMARIAWKLLVSGEAYAGSSVSG